MGAGGTGPSSGSGAAPPAALDISKLWRNLGQARQVGSWGLCHSSPPPLASIVLYIRHICIRPYPVLKRTLLAYRASRFSVPLDQVAAELAAHAKTCEALMAGLRQSLPLWLQLTQVRVAECEGVECFLLRIRKTLRSGVPARRLK